MTKKKGPKKDKKLDFKRLRFAEEYIVDWNGKQAAIRAGYSPRTAESQASRLLTNVKVREYIEECKNKIEQLAGVSKLRAVREWSKLAFSNVTDIFDIVDGRVVLRDGITKLSDLPRETTDILSELQENPAGGVKMKSYCKDNALVQLAKLLGWNEADKLDHTTKGESLNDISKLSTAELIERAKATKKIDEQA